MVQIIIAYLFSDEVLARSWMIVNSWQRLVILFILHCSLTCQTMLIDDLGWFVLVPLNSDPDSVEQKYSFWKDKDTNSNTTISFTTNHLYSDTYLLQSYHLFKNSLAGYSLVIGPIRPPPTGDNKGVSILVLQGLAVEFLKKNDNPWFSVHR